MEEFKDKFPENFHDNGDPKLSSEADELYPTKDADPKKEKQRTKKIQAIKAELKALLNKIKR